MSDFSEIIKRINKANDIALFCHTNPDGDAIGSMLAMYFALKKKGKRVTAYCDVKISNRLTFFEGSEYIILPNSEKHELAISVDTSTIEMLGGSLKTFLMANSQIAIDHHSSFKRFADLSYVEKDACACAQIIYKLLKEMKLLDKTIAKLLFGGIVTDSGCFAFSSVSCETHEFAADLMSYGFDASDVIFNVYRKTTKERFELKSRVLAKAKFFNDDQIGFLTFSKEDFEKTHTSTADTEGIVNELIDIDKVKVAIAISEVGDKNFKVSIRSKEPIDASEIAGAFGGGGHKRAAGCRVNGYLEDVIDRLKKLASDRI